jgi:CheY-like chemotaxis protein
VIDRVLIVDDDPEMRELYGHALRGVVRELRSAPDGETALRVLDTWTPDVIVLDLTMPGMNGVDFLGHRSASPALRAIPVVVASGTVADREALLAMGADEVLAKPFPMGAMTCAMQRAAGGEAA